jgi:hypothetical protein
MQKGTQPMFWTLVSVEPLDPAAARAAGAAPIEGRFVIHRHRDAQGPHLDLRLEQDGCLSGLRVDADALEPGAWASEKPPHALHWLRQDGDAVRVDAGAYAWERRDAEVRAMRLDGAHGVRRLEWRCAGELPPHCVRALIEAGGAVHAAPDRLADLVRDGAEARGRAVARLCGLGRELDGPAFDAAAWRRLLEPLSLREIHGHLAAFETRFDRAFPPEPVSRPESLEDEAQHASAQSRADQALRLLRE